MRRRPVAIGMPSPLDRIRDIRPPARIFALSVMVVAAAAWAAALVVIGTESLGDLVTDPQLYLIGGLIVVADLYPAVPWMRDVRGRVRLHFSGAFSLALVLICGPAAGLLFPVISLISQATMRTALWRRMFNTAVLTLEALVGSAVAYLIFGPWPQTPSATVLLIGGAVIALMWEAVNVAMVCLAQTLLNATRLAPTVRMGLRRTMPWLATLVASPAIAFGLLHAPALTPSLALLTVSIHHTIASMIRASDDARTDQLTGLANRTGALEELDERLSLADASGDVAALMVDLDDFKIVNDEFGHSAGDHVLAEVGRRLRDIADDMLAARLGGDEFILIGTGPRDIDRLTLEICAAVAEPIRLPGDDHTVSVSCSVGSATAPPGTKSLRLLRAADLEMYRHKGAGPSENRPAVPPARVH